MSTPINNIILDRIELIQLNNLSLLKETFPLLRQLELEVIQRGEQALLKSHQMPCLLIKNNTTSDSCLENLAERSKILMTNNVPKPISKIKHLARLRDMSHQLSHFFFLCSQKKLERESKFGGQKPRFILNITFFF